MHKRSIDEIDRAVVPATSSQEVDARLESLVRGLHDEIVSTRACGLENNEAEEIVCPAALAPPSECHARSPLGVEETVETM